MMVCRDRRDRCVLDRVACSVDGIRDWGEAGDIGEDRCQARVLRWSVRLQTALLPASLAGSFDRRGDAYLIAFLITDPSRQLG